jgi:hypothetical protein
MMTPIMESIVLICLRQSDGKEIVVIRRQHHKEDSPLIQNEFHALPKCVNFGRIVTTTDVIKYFGNMMG